jgi:hypothetical protein
MPAPDLSLDPRQHVDVAEQHQVLAALPKGVHVPMLVNGSPQAGDDERGDQGGLPGPCLQVPQVRASLRDIDLEQPVHHRLVVGGPDRLLHEAPALRIRDDVVFTLLVHRSTSHPFTGSILLLTRRTSPRSSLDEPVDTAGREPGVGFAGSWSGSTP